MVLEEQLQRLLQHWDELQKQGREVPAEELCRDTPELLPELRAAIRAKSGSLKSAAQSTLRSADRTDDTFAGAASSPRAAGGKQAAAQGPSLDTFLAQLAASGLMSPAEIAEFSADSAVAAQNSTTLARELVDRGKLTRYQAAAVFQGKTRGLVFGDYVVLDRIGAGGMGQVYKARHRRMDRIVALKALPAAAMKSSEAVQRFQREVKAAARLHHPHIVTAFDAGEHDGAHYLVMEFVDGVDLSHLVKSSGPLAVKQAVENIVQACRGLEHAHSEGVIHRDIKPSNLLLDKKGTVKILDMGLARMDCALASDAAAEGLTNTGNIMGTVDFMAPEQALDTKHADQRSDIYSLGCTLYCLLTGKKLFEEDTVMKKLLAHREGAIPSLTAVRADVPAAVDVVYQRMVAKRPADRYQTVTEARLALESALNPMAAPENAAAAPLCRGKLVPPDQLGNSTKRGRPKPKSRAPRFVGAAIVSVALMAGGWALWQTSSGVKLTDEPTAVAVEPPTSTPVVATPADKQVVESKPATAENPSAAPPPTSPPIAPPQIARDESVSPPAAAALPANPAAERRAAEWALSMGGRVFVAVDNGKPTEVTRQEDLPSGPFVVDAIDVSRNPDVTDNSLAVLDGLEKLRSLNVSETSITDSANDHFRRLPGLRMLYITGTIFTDAGFEKLANQSELLGVHANATQLTDRGAESLARLRNLQTVEMGSTQVTDAGLAVLAKPSLVRLVVVATRITDAGVAHLKNCPNLNAMLASDTPLTDASLDTFAGLRKLKLLRLRNTKITDAGIAKLEKMTWLDRVQIDVTGVTQAGYDKLLAALPNCVIEWAPPTTAAAVDAKTPPPARVTAAETENRLPVPAESEQRRALEQLKDVFRDDLAAAKKSDDKAALAERLIRQADETRDDAASAYAMLIEAQALAIDAAEAPLLVRTADALGVRYTVDSSEVLADSLEKTTQKAHPAASFKSVADVALERIDAALADDRLDLAKRLGDAALAAARKAKDSATLKTAVDRNKALVALKQQADAVAAAKATLANSPDDAEANLVVGRYLCFTKSEWPAGLANLAKGSDATLKELAAKSLVDPPEAASQAELGELWAKAADAAKGKSKTDLQAGARYWYSKAAPALTGLAKAKAEQRLKQLGLADTPVGKTATAPRPGRKSSPAEQLARDRKVAEWVLAERGKIGIMAPYLPSELIVERVADLPPQGFFLTKIDLTLDKQLADESLSNLEGLVNLQFLSLGGCSLVSDAGLEHVKDLTNLTYLNIESTRITDAGLKHLAGLKNLQTLYLTNRPITDAGLESLHDLNNLTYLAVVSTKITDAGLVHLKNFPRLQRLFIWNTAISDAGLDKLQALPVLTELELSQTKITDAGLVKLYPLRNLTRLILKNLKLSDPAIDKLQANLPNCKIQL